MGPRASLDLFEEDRNLSLLQGIEFRVPKPIAQSSSFFLAKEPPLGQGLLIHEALRSHSDTSHSVGFLWTSDQPVAETAT